MPAVSKNLYVNDEGFVFDYYTGLTYVLNRTGVLVLKKLQDGMAVADIVHALQETYGISERVAVGDADEFLQQLSALGLVVTDGSIGA